MLSPIGAMCSGLPPLWWPSPQPDEQRDYYLDVTALMTVPDTIVSTMVRVSPSGFGEMTVTSLFIGQPLTDSAGHLQRDSAGNIQFSSGPSSQLIQVGLAGGVAGRLYIVRINVITAYPRHLTWLVGVQVNDTLASYPLPPAPVAGFGPPTFFPAPPSNVLRDSAGTPLQDNYGNFLLTS